ncbi:MAG: hypothetical protein KF837_11530 [Labilithrix sp.]|nr:hypothetical protein [Labilithrix sp.]
MSLAPTFSLVTHRGASSMSLAPLVTHASQHERRPTLSLGEGVALRGSAEAAPPSSRRRLIRGVAAPAAEAAATEPGRRVPAEG